MDKPRLIKGGVDVDDRGIVTFCNDFDMSEIKRFYMLENHEQGYVRAWHGHIKEAKWVVCVSGVAVVGVAEMVGSSKTRCPDPDAYGKWIDVGVERFALHEPESFTLHPNGDILYIPPGYANGHKNLVTGTRVLHFSSMTMEEAGEDDYRFDSSIHGWVWEVKSR